MQMSEQFDISTLAWVKGEIDETLKQARVALESHVEDAQQTDRLQACWDFIHQVHGTLQIVELTGAALLAEEMERLTEALLNERVTEVDAGHEALMRAILQLPDYLERLLGGEGDNPNLLLPLLNEMRALRGETALDGAAFFRPDLTITPPARPPGEQQPAISAQQAAAKLHRFYLSSLAKLLKGKEVKGSLDVLANLIDRLNVSATQESWRRILWVAGAFIEGLRDKHIPLSRESKLPLGKLEQLIKKVASDGELAESEQVASLMQTMLYQLASADASGRQAAAVRLAFRLDRYLPGASAGPGNLNADLKKTVAGDIIEDLSRIKDVFDIFVRSDRRALDDLAPMAQGLGRLADTLGLLQEETLRGLMHEQQAVIEQLLAGEIAPSEETLMGIAGAILTVESALVDWGSDAPMVLAEVNDEQLDAAQSTPQAEAEHQRVTRQVMREARDDLIRVREAISHYLARPEERSLLKPLPGLLHMIIGSLNMLSYKRVAHVLSSCRAFIERDLCASSELPEAERLDALADAVMSVEYYLEAFIHSRVHPGSVLDVAEEAVATLGYPIGTVQPLAMDDGQQAVADTAIIVEAEDFAELEADEPGDEAAPANQETDDPKASFSAGDATTPDTAIPDQFGHGETASTTAAAHTAPSVAEHAPSASETPTPAVQQDEVAVASTPAAGTVDVDEEILEIFIEEAEEELANIGQMLPQWVADPSDGESLKTLRRSFHTLKGSGRLVGAAELGEFAWAFENMLNKVIEATLPPSATLFDLLEQAHDVLPQLIEQFRTGVATDNDAQRLQEMATAMVQGGTSVTHAPAADKAAPSASNEGGVGSADSQAIAELEPVLLDIYRMETEGHLKQIDEYLENYATGGSHKVSEPLIRALHTLKGSSRMAGVAPVAEVCAVLEKYTKTLQASHESISEQGVEALTRCTVYIRAVLDYLLDRDKPEPDGTQAQTLADAVFDEVQHLAAMTGAQPELGLIQWQDELAAAGADEMWSAETCPVPEASGKDEAPAEAAGTPSEDAGDTQEKTAFAEAAPQVSEGADNAVAPVEGERRSAADTPAFTAEVSAALAEAESWKGTVLSLDEAEVAAVTAEMVSPGTPEGAVAARLTADAPEPEPEPEPEPDKEKGHGQAPVAELATVQPSQEVYDDELLDIFLEEANEILDDSERTLQEWVDNPADRSLVEALQRQLHTLKGGARMAGIQAVGDLSHSLESILEAINDGLIASSPEMMRLLQLSHDRLVTMLEQVRNHQPLSSGDDLIAQINRLSHRGEVTDPSQFEEAAGQTREAGQRGETSEQHAAGDPVDAAMAMFGASTAPARHTEPGAAAQAPTDVTRPLSLAIDELEFQLSNWLHDVDDRRLFNKAFNAAEALAGVCTAHGQTEMAGISQAVVKLLGAIIDGHVPVSGKARDIIAVAMDRLRHIVEQIKHREKKDDGSFIIADIDEWSTLALAEQGAIAIEPDASLTQTDSAESRAAALPEAQGAAPDEAESDKRRGNRIMHEVVRVRSDLLDNLVNHAGRSASTVHASNSRSPASATISRKWIRPSAACVARSGNLKSRTRRRLSHAAKRRSRPVWRISTRSRWTALPIFSSSHAR
jgi:chemosensory pili system protein ChpA (sensor histidine kinase/response regulator)